MPNNTVSDWSTTAASNTEVGGVDLAENSMRPRDVNNAIRTMMAQIATGIDNSEFGSAYFHPASASSAAYLDFAEDTDNGTNKITVIASASVASDKTITLPDLTGTVALTDAAQTISAVQTFSAVPVLSGGAVSFPATQVPSADANTLDDYEEGTWTPGLTFGGSATGITYTRQEGSYVKVGRIVFVQGRITLTNNGSGTGTARLTGAPFTSAATYFAALPFAYWTGTSGVVGNPVCFLDPSATSGEILMSGGSNTVTVTDTILTNTADLIFSGAYKASA